MPPSECRLYLLSSLLCLCLFLYFWFTVLFLLVISSSPLPILSSAFQLITEKPRKRVFRKGADVGRRLMTYRDFHMTVVRHCTALWCTVLSLYWAVFTSLYAILLYSPPFCSLQLYSIQLYSILLQATSDILLTDHYGVALILPMSYSHLPPSFLLPPPWHCYYQTKRSELDKLGDRTRKEWIEVQIKWNGMECDVLWCSN